MRLAGVGDLVVMRPLAHVRTRPPDSLLQVLDGADLAVGNLEVLLTEVDDPQRTDIALRADPALVGDVAALGVHAVSIANNHCGDHGWAALRGMADALAAAGVAALGIGDDEGRAFAPVLRQAAGLDVALVAATCVGHERFMAAAGRPGMAGVRVSTTFQPDETRLTWEPGTPPRVATAVRPADEARLLDSVAAAHEWADVVVAVVHWGVSWSERPERYQHDLGRRLVEAGASAVLGCHAHTLQGVEVHRGAPIFHGLGSFVFGYDGPLAPRMPRDAAVALLDVSPGGRVTAARLVLGRLDAGGEPVRAHPERAALIAEILTRQSAGWGAEARLEGDTLILSL